MPRHVDDAPEGVAGAALQCQLAQEGRVLHRVEVVGVLELLLLRGQHEAALHRHHGRQALLAQRLGQPQAAMLGPQGLGAVEVAEVAEGVEVVIPHLQPVAEMDAELVAAMGGAQELRLVDADQLVVVADGREGCLADADDADLLGLDDLDRDPALQPRDQRGSRHPTGAAPADNHDALVLLRHDFAFDLERTRGLQRMLPMKTPRPRVPT